MSQNEQKSVKVGKRKAVRPYLTNRQIAPGTFRDVRKENTPYEVPSTTKIMPYVNYSDAKDRQSRINHLHNPVHAKANIRMQQVADLSNRNFIEQPPAPPVCTVVDFYSEFYSVIEGRPLGCSSNFQLYLNDIRNYAMLKQQIGYRRDMTMQLGKSLGDERVKYEHICKEYKAHVDNFQLFIRDDHLSVMEKVREADQVRTALNVKNLEYFPLVSKMMALNGRILELEDMRQTAKTYRKFIFSISPLSWRSIYDESYKRTRIVFDFELERESGAKEINMDLIIQHAKMELTHHKNQPHMYFTHPDQLIDYFENLVIQCKKYLLHLLSLASPVEKIHSVQRRYKETLKAEEDALKYYVQNAEIEVDRMNESTKQMKKLFWILMHSSYFTSLAPPDVLKLNLCIEFVFLQVFGQSGLKQDATMPMKLIEELYDGINLKLDFMDAKIVKESQEECFREDLHTMRAAYDAAKKLRSFEILEKAIRSAFVPPAKFRRPVFEKFKKKVPKAKKKQALEATNLSNIQRENLELFTTWCQNDDPEPYLDNLKNCYFNLAS